MTCAASHISRFRCNRRIFSELDSITIGTIIQLLVAGLLIGFLIGLTGVGGGVLVLPTLTQVFGLGPVAAVGTASLYAFLTKVYAVFEHWRRKNIAWKISGIFLACAIPGCIIAALFLKDRAQEESFSIKLTFFIIFIMIVSLVTMVINLIKGKKKLVEEDLEVATESPELGKGRMVFGCVLSFLVGGVLGATGIGGGVLVIPILIMVFSLSTKRTVGSSILIAVALCLLTASLLAMGGGEKESLTNFPYAITMALGSLAGVWFGSRLSVKMPDRPLKAIVVALIAIATVMMGVDAFNKTHVVDEKTDSATSSTERVRSAAPVEPVAETPEVR